MEQLWSMYNKDERLRIDDLKTEHVRIILLAIPNNRMHEWYACREGSMQWTPIAEIPEFYEDVRALKGLSAQPSGNEIRMIDESEFKATGTESVNARPSSLARTGKIRKQNLKPLEEPKKTNSPGAGAKSPSKGERRPLFEDDPDTKTGPMFAITATAHERRSARRYPRSLQFEVQLGGKSFQCKTRDISIGGVSLDQPLPAWIPKTFRAGMGKKGKMVRVLCAKVTESKLKILETESWDAIRKWIVNW